MFIFKFFNFLLFWKLNFCCCVLQRFILRDKNGYFCSILLVLVVLHWKNVINFAVVIVYLTNDTEKENVDHLRRNVLQIALVIRGSFTNEISSLTSAFTCQIISVFPLVFWREKEKKNDVTENKNGALVVRTLLN